MPFEFKGVSELAATFGVLPAELKAALKPAVLEAAGLIGDKASDNASFSSWIPGAVSVSASFSGSGGGAVVKGAERGFPHSGEVRTYEGNGESPTPFLRPVFGRHPGVPAMTQPFLGPAVEDEREPAIGVIAEAVAAVARANGF
jgi:hypothetical protein